MNRLSVVSIILPALVSTSICHFPFVICHCRNRTGQAMANDKCNMENGK